jgi:RNA ligase
MARYQFPIIEHLNDVLPAIEGRDEFIRAERGDVIILDYAVNFIDTFPDPLEAPDDVTARLWSIRRECRGLIFCAHTGKVLRRQWPKFFNVLERLETQLDKITISDPHHVLDKLDGSCLSPYQTIDGVLRWGTMMGETDTAAQALPFIADHPQYEAFARWAISEDMTPIFEWCSRKNRIVIDHPEDKLILTGMRTMRTGEFTLYPELAQLGSDWNISVVHAWDTITDFNAFITHVKALTEGEGVVIRFHDGHHLKLKSDLYCAIHRARDGLTLEKNVIEVILNKSIDDVLPNLPPEDQDRVNRFSKDLYDGIKKTAENLQVMVHGWQAIYPDATKKEFAVNFVSKQPKEIKAFLFGIYDGRNAFDLVLKNVLDNTSTSTKVDSVRDLFGGINWFNY